MSSVPDEATDDSEDLTTGAGGIFVGDDGKGTLSSTLFITVYTFALLTKLAMGGCFPLSLDLFSLLWCSLIRNLSLSSLFLWVCDATD